VNDETEHPPIGVQLANAPELAREIGRHSGCSGPRDIEPNTKTFTLKTAQTSDPVDSIVQRILDRDPHRLQALIVVTSGTIYLCHSRAQAQAAAGDASTVGGAQDGFLVAAGQYVPPLLSTDPLWAAIPSDKAGAGAQVSVLSERRRA
jgi:hypothetical protein